MVAPNTMGENEFMAESFMNETDEVHSSLTEISAI